MNVLLILGVGGCALWLVQAAALLHHLTELRAVADTPIPERDAWPSVSALVPARDEERFIAQALRSRLADDYPSLQLVVIDDRSTDATPELIAEVAETDDRVTPMRIDELPDGWLGKLYALHEGVNAATGEWLLISDADVHMMPGGMKKSIAYCERHGLDFLALVPEFRSASFTVNVLWAVFMRVLATFMNPAAVRDRGSKTAMGSGGFMLARREVFMRTPGYGHLRMDTTDDLALGVMMKQAGAACDFANGRGIATVDIYGDLSEFLRGVEKNAGSLATSPFPMTLLVILLAGVVEYAPFLALASGVPWAQWLGAACVVMATFATMASTYVNARMLLPALFWPVGWFLVAAGIVRSAWLYAVRGGVMWRDTFYSKEQILEGRRFKLM